MTELKFNWLKVNHHNAPLPFNVVQLDEASVQCSCLWWSTHAGCLRFSFTVCIPAQLLNVNICGSIKSKWTDDLIIQLIQLRLWQTCKHTCRASNAFLGNYLTATPRCKDDIYAKRTGAHDELMPTEPNWWQISDLIDRLVSAHLQLWRDSAWRLYQCLGVNRVSFSSPMVIFVLR